MFCSKCGKEIDNDSRFCPHCGADVGGSSAKKASGNQGARKSVPVISIVGGMAVVLVIACVFIFKSLGGGEDAEPASGLAKESSDVPEVSEDNSSDQLAHDDGLGLAYLAPETLDIPSEIVETTAEPVTEETIYSIDRYDVQKLLQDFCDLQVECIAEYVKLCKNAAKKPDEPANAVELMNQYQGGVIYGDSRFAILEDYDAEYLKGLDDIQRRIRLPIEQCLAQSDTMYYTTQTLIEDSNLGTEFRYYSGTNNTIGVKMHYYFYYNDVPIKGYEGERGTSIVTDQDANCVEIAYVYAVLVNCGKDVWAIKYFAVNESNVPDGEELFPEKLRNEDELKSSAEAVGNVNDEELQKALNAYYAVAGEQTVLFDFNNSNIPYFFTEASKYSHNYKLYHYENDELIEIELTSGSFYEFYYRSDSDYIVTCGGGAVTICEIWQLKDGKFNSIGVCDNGGIEYDEMLSNIGQIIGTDDFTTEYTRVSSYAFTRLEYAIQDYQTGVHNDDYEVWMSRQQ